MVSSAHFTFTPVKPSFKGGIFHVFSLSLPRCLNNVDRVTTVNVAKMLQVLHVTCDDHVTHVTPGQLSCHEIFSPILLTLHDLIVLIIGFMYLMNVLHTLSGFL